MPARMEVEVRCKFYDKDLRGYNVVAEIPGTDRKDEVVMLGDRVRSNRVRSIQLTFLSLSTRMSALQT